MIRRRQLSLLFTCNLATLAVGTGLLPLLPVRAIQLGASPSWTGYYLAFSYFALTLGTLSGGWLADRLQRRKGLLLAAAAVGTLFTWLLGLAADGWQLVGLTAVVWFCRGIVLVETAILAGLLAHESERGRVFGLLGLSTGLAGVLGNLSAGRVADALGYPSMFMAMAAFFALSALLGLPLRDREVTSEVLDARAKLRGAGRLPGQLLLLLGASLAASSAVFAFALGRSLAMDGMGLPASAISGTAAVAAAVGMPVPVLLGWLSDRSGRKWTLVVGYLATAGSLVVLALSTSLWAFYLAACLVSVNASTPLGRALAADLVPSESLGRGMSAFDASGWGAGIVGFAITGHLVQSLGLTPAILALACLPLLSIGLLMPIREASPQGRPSTSAA